MWFEYTMLLVMFGSFGVLTITLGKGKWLLIFRILGKGYSVPVPQDCIVDKQYCRICKSTKKLENNQSQRKTDLTFAVDFVSLVACLTYYTFQ